MLLGFAFGLVITLALRVIFGVAVGYGLMAIGTGGLVTWLSRDPYDPSTALLVLGIMLIVGGLLILIFRPNLD